MGKALYRTHRPKKLDEVIGQEHVTTTLQQALKQGRISHAYLLTGPRGVGKTSIARILAHEINDLPYDDDTQHIDIIEIDAASNRRIDEIRELRDKVYVAPVSAKYKVYIIDEVHMLTREAFNALLKTLEEPPAHVVFILATTDAHKLPGTIVSRTQRFNFKPVARDQVVEHLRSIAKQEKLKISDEALSLLAEHGAGSFRDSISLLDQASNQDGIVEVEDVRRLLGIPPTEALQQLLNQLSGGSTTDLLAQVDELYNQGYQAAAIAQQLSKLLRQQLITASGPLSASQALDLLDQLLAVTGSRQPEHMLEIVLLRAAPAAVKPLEEIAQPRTENPQPKRQPDPAPTHQSKPPAADTTEPAKSPAPSTRKQPKLDLNAEHWTAVLNAVKQRHNTVYSIVRMAQPRFPGDNSLELAFAFPFHQKRLNEAANRQLLNEALEEITGAPVKLTLIVDKDASPPPAPAAAEPEPAAPVTDSPTNGLAAISNIFGGGELLES